MIILYVLSVLICLGWHLAKSESSFIDADWTYWLIAAVCMIFAPLWLALVLGYKLHGEAL